MIVCARHCQKQIFQPTQVWSPFVVSLGFPWRGFFLEIAVAPPRSGSLLSQVSPDRIVLSPADLRALNRLIIQEHEQCHLHMISFHESPTSLRPASQHESFASPAGCWTPPGFQGPQGMQQSPSSHPADSR